jgi:CIC family chloride channel protein
MSTRSLRVKLPGALRLPDLFRTHRTGLVALALAVGASAGVGAIVFRYLILWFTLLFSGHDDPSAAGHAAHPLLPALGSWFMVLAPVAGGLLYGPLIHWFAREARGHGVPEVMLAVAERCGRIAPRVAVIKSLASAICIGSGGSVGREGPIVQIGSALGSAVGQALRVSESRLRLLVAAGAAAGIAATFNAPIAGVIFALELILRDFEAQSFGVVVLASVVSSVIGRAAFGSAAFLSLPPFELASLWEYVLYAGLGLVAALVGVAFIRVLYGIEDVSDRLWRGPEWLRPAAGGIVLGLVLLALPELYGVGYPVLESAIQGQHVVVFLLVLLAGKMLATSLTIGIGGSGGVFAPSLFMGAMLGTAYGRVMHAAMPGIVGPAGAYGLVGMGAVFAAASRAPITAVIIIFELTGEYHIILPLMFSIALAAGISTLLSRDTIYTLKLRRRGIDIMRGRSANLMELLTVGEAMRPVPEPLREDQPLNEVVARFTGEARDALPVVDATGCYRGSVLAREVEQSMRDNVLDTTAGDLAQETATLTPQESLEQALGDLVRSDAPGLPVLDPERRAMIGWLTHHDVLWCYNERLQRSVARAEERGGHGAPWRPGPPPLARLRGYRIVDLAIRGERAPVGRRLIDIAWPPSSIVLAIRRDGQTLTPDEATELRRDDRLTVLVAAQHADALGELVSEPRRRAGS